jgi:hypothetical protein
MSGQVSELTNESRSNRVWGGYASRDVSHLAWNSRKWLTRLDHQARFGRPFYSPFG